jgi:hypothetical protein
MTAFDLLFIFATVGSAVTIAVAAMFAVRGQRSRAFKLLRLYCICAAGYFAVGVAVAFLRPQRVINVGDPWCFDDWCMTVEKVVRTNSTPEISYNVDLHISSLARRATQRANKAWIYLIDDQGRRYSADPAPSAVRLDVLLRPLESASTQRTFRVPADAHGLGLITGHGGPYCGPMDILVIGSGGCLFRKPTMIRIQ